MANISIRNKTKKELLLHDGKPRYLVRVTPAGTFDCPLHKHWSPLEIANSRQLEAALADHTKFSVVVDGTELSKEDGLAAVRGWQGTETVEKELPLGGGLTSAGIKKDTGLTTLPGIQFPEATENVWKLTTSVPKALSDGRLQLKLLCSYDKPIVRSANKVRFDLGCAFGRLRASRPNLVTKPKIVDLGAQSRRGLFSVVFTIPSGQVVRTADTVFLILRRRGSHAQDTYTGDISVHRVALSWSTFKK